MLMEFAYVWQDVSNLEYGSFRCAGLQWQSFCSSGYFYCISNTTSRDLRSYYDSAKSLGSGWTHRILEGGECYCTAVEWKLSKGFLSSVFVTTPLVCPLCRRQICSIFLQALSAHRQSLLSFKLSGRTAIWDVQTQISTRRFLQFHCKAKNHWLLLKCPCQIFS